MKTRSNNLSEIRVPLDPVTRERLLSLAKVCGDDPDKIAASLLHDLLDDDDFYSGNGIVRH